MNANAQNPFITTWKTDIPGASNSTSITIPTTGTGYNYDVDWNNDGTFDDFNVSGSITHDYGIVGIYDVAIRGAFPRIYFNNTGDKDKITTVRQWGDIQWISMEHAFSGCSNIFCVAVDAPDLSNVRSLESMFSKATSFIGIGTLNNWNVSNITNMSATFFEAPLFNSDLNNWNVSSVSNMSKMFAGASTFNGDINGWNTAKVTNMSMMFQNASAFDGNIGNWDVSGVTDMSNMFQSTQKFNGNIGNWIVSRVVKMTDMFKGAVAFNQNLNNWDVSSVIDFSGMFNSATNYNNGGVSLSWNNNLGVETNMDYMFNNAINFNHHLGGLNMNSVSGLNNMLSNSGLSVESYDSTLIYWQAEPVQNGITLGATGLTYCNGEMARANLISTNGWVINGDAKQCPVDTTSFITTWKTDNPGISTSTSITIPTTGGGYSYDVDWENDGTYDDFGLTGNITHDYGTAGTYQVAIRGDFPRIYFNNEGDKDKVISIDQWGNINWESMRSSYSGCDNLFYNSIDAPNLNSVSDFYGAFSGANNFNGDLNNWDVSNVTDMSYMFNGTYGFNGDISSWDVSGVVLMTSMFRYVDSFNVDISNWDVSGVTSISGMFQFADNFNIDISAWNVSNVSDMFGVFGAAYSFNQNLANWDISSVTDMTGMLYNSGLSTENYDSTLIGWKAQTVQPNITLGAFGLTYCNAETERQNLIDNNGWIITGDAKQCPVDTTFFITTWKTDNPGISNNTTITIPTFSGETYSYDVDWENDGTFDDFGVTGDITHNYGMAGTYQVAIRGSFPRIYFNNGFDNQDKEKILTIDQWGNIAWTNMNRAFFGCSNLNVTATDVPDLSLVTDMSNMFAKASSFNGDLSNWDVSSGTNFYRMFASASIFNKYIGGWDVSIGENFSEMFAGATSFNQDIGSWNVSNGTDFSSMFLLASSFNQDVSLWNVGLGTDFSNMFDHANSFNQDVDTWNVSSGTNFSNMFNFATNFNQSLESWNVSLASTMPNMFRNAIAFNQNLGSWNISSVADLTDMLNNSALSTENYDSTLIGWQAQTVQPNVTLGATGLTYCMAEEERQNLIDNKGWIITGDAKQCPVDTTSFITTWKTDNPGTFNSTSITIPTTGSGYNYDVDWENDGIFDEFGLTGNVTHDYGIAGTYQVAIRGAFPRIYFNNAGDKEKILNINQWGEIDWESMAKAFYGCSELKYTALDAPDLSNVTIMAGMFWGATSFNGNLNNWDVSNVEIMSFMFKDASSFNGDVRMWNVSNVTETSQMFEKAEAFDQNLSNWDVSSVERMSAMFANATAFNNGGEPLTWNNKTINVTSMAAMFINATNFNQDVGNWNVSFVDDMPNMFKSATSFNQNLGAWNVSSVTNMTDILSNSALSTENYDSTLIGWQAQNVQLNLTLGVDGLTYCNAETERQRLIDIDGWTITGDSRQCITNCRGDDSLQLIVLYNTLGGPNWTNTLANDQKWLEGPINTWKGVTLNAAGCVSEINLIGNNLVGTLYDFNFPELTDLRLTDNQLNGSIPDFQNLPNLEYLYLVQNHVTGSIPNFSNTPNLITISIIDNQLSGSIPNFSNLSNLTTFLAHDNQIVDSIPNFANLPSLVNLDVSNNLLTHIPGFTNLPNLGVGLGSNYSIANNLLTFEDILPNINISPTFYNYWPQDSIYKDTTITLNEGETFTVDLGIDEAVDSNKYVWYKDNVKIDSSYSNTFTINSVVIGDAGVYTCIVTNKNALLLTLYSRAITLSVTSNFVPFITTWETTTDNESITIPTTGTGYLYDIDWNNDGTFEETGVTGDAIHIYPTAGMYRVAIKGDFPRIYFNGGQEGQDTAKIISIDQWGDIQWESMANAFYGCSNLNSTAPDNPDLSNVEYTSGMFQSASSFNANLNSWNVSNVTVMSSMFLGASSYNQNMDTWDVSNVKDMSLMFRNASSFNQNISNWNVSSVFDFFGMFNKAIAFNNNDQPLTWEINSITETSMIAMFKDANNFNQNLGSWNIRAVSEMPDMLSGSGLSTENYDSTLISWQTQTVQPNINLGATDLTYCNAESERDSLIINSGWIITGDSLLCDISPCEPPIVIGDSSSVCSGDSALLMVANAQGQITWYSDAALTNIISQDTFLQTPPLFAGQTYYIIDSSATCPNDSGKATILVNPPPIVQIFAPNTVEAGDSATLSAALVFGQSYNWFNENLDPIVAQGSTFTTGALFNDTTYYLNVVTDSGCTNGFDTVNIIINTNTCINDSTYNILYVCDPLMTALSIDTFTNSNGCDSVVVIDSIFGYYDTITNFVTTCDSTILGDTIQNRMMTVLGCQLTNTIYNQLLPAYETLTYLETCDTNSVGIIYDTLTTLSGCDSIIITETKLDTTAPQISCISDISIQVDPGETIDLVPIDFIIAATDNCSLGDTSMLPNQLQYEASIVTTITVADIHGNETSCQVNITAIDEEVRFCADLLVNLGPDITSCIPILYEFEDANNYDSIRWSTDNSNLSTLLLTNTTSNIEITAYRGNCYNTDAFNFTRAPQPDDRIIENDEITECGSALIASSYPYEDIAYEWSTGENTKDITVLESGIYWLKVTVPGGCTYQDTVFVRVNEKPSLEIDNNSVCGQTFLNISNSTLIRIVNVVTNTTVFGYSGNVVDTTIVLEDGLYNINLQNEANCDVTFQSVAINSNQIPLLEAVGPSGPICTAFTLYDNYGLTTPNNASYVWMKEGSLVVISNNYQVTVNEPGNYIVHKTENGCSSWDTVAVEYGDEAEPLAEILQESPDNAWHTFKHQNPTACNCDYIVWTAINRDNNNAVVDIDTNSVYNVQLNSGVRYWVVMCAYGSSCNANNIAIAKDTIKVEPDYITSINNYNLNLDWIVYPNPNDGHFTIDIKSLKHSNMMLEIVDVVGRVIFRKEEEAIQNWKEDIYLDMPSGVYHVVLKTEKGFASKKIILYK